MLKDKNFTTFEQQIEILKRRNMKFGSEETAISVLRRFGYYNVINGYKDLYVYSDNGNENYLEGVSFEQIFSLYTMDRSIRSAIMEAMEEIEDNLRSAVAHTIAEAFTAEENKYLNRSNYKLGRQREDGIYQLDNILAKFEKIRNDNVEPMKHARETYGNVPPWILLKGASFGNLVNFVKLLHRREKDCVISLMYDIPQDIISNMPMLKDLFMDTLFVCLDYRNAAAHNKRMYNLETKASFRFSHIIHDKVDITEADYRHGKGKSGIPVLVSAISLFDNKLPSMKAITRIDYAVRIHCDDYPADKEALLGLLSLQDNIFDSE